MLVLLDHWVVFVAVLTSCNCTKFHFYPPHAGAVHIHNCNINQMIPVWMIVFGSSYILMVTFSILSFLWDCIYNFGKNLPERHYLNIFDIMVWIVSLFIFAWLIVGSVWVLGYYRAWSGAGRQNCSVNHATSLCCEKPVFMFSFVIIIIDWVLILLTLVIYILSILCGLFFFTFLGGFWRTGYNKLP